MSQLEKATLTVLPDGDPIPVQFNPSSMKLEIKNSVEGGASRGKQQRQYTGTSSTTLSLDLIFDTCDEGTEEEPVSVRTKTALVEQFLYPVGDGDAKQAPPKLRFHWGDLILEGAVESLSIDLDHFAASGVPLRAKVGFSFKEQDYKYEYNAAGAGANNGPTPPPPGVSSAAPGAAAPGPTNRVGQALAGESAAGFAARMGLNPAAWRGLDLSASTGGSLTLDAGVQVGFNASLSAGLGLGVTAGVSAGVQASVEASFGLQSPTPPPTPGRPPDPSQGFALSAAGGVGSAIEAVKISKAQAAGTQALQSFGAAQVLSPPSTATPAMPDQQHTPLIASGMPGPAEQQSEPPAPTAPAADPRAVSFGYGIPLRPSLGGAAEQRASLLRGSGTAAASTLPTTIDPTVPGWVALQAGNSPAQAKAPRIVRVARRCGCGCNGR